MIPTDFQLRLTEVCGRLDCGPGWCRTRENSLGLADAEVWLVWRGRGWMRSRDREFALLPGFCALMRPGGIYDAGHDEANPLGITYIHFNAWPGRGRARQDSAWLYRQWPEFFDLSDLDFYDASLRRVIQLLPRLPEVANALMRATLLDLLHSEPAPTGGGAVVPGGQRKKISQLVVSIHSKPTRLPRVSEMARELHWSQAHFSRVFRLVTQQTPSDFLLQLRLSRARHLLAETSMGVGEIAERLDYADLYFFSRQFKQKTGLSPLQYRQRIARHPGSNERARKRPQRSRAQGQISQATV